MLRLLSSLLAATLSCAVVQADTVALPLDTAPTGAWYLEATVDDLISTHMLVDTGSGYVSLTQETFAAVAKVPSTRLQRHIRAIMANGKAVSVPIYHVDTLQLGAACLLHDIEVAVMPSATRDILGLSALRQLQPFTLSLDPPTLTATCRTDS